MAAEDALEGEPEAFEGAVLAEGFEGVLGAGRSVAAGWGSERRDAQLIELYQQHERRDEYFLEDSHHFISLRILATVSLMSAKGRTSLLSYWKRMSAPWTWQSPFCVR